MFNAGMMRDRQAVENIQRTALVCKVQMTKIDPNDSLMDSGCNNYMTNKEENCLSVRPTEEPLGLVTADGNMQRVQGFGNMVLKSRFDKVLNLRDTVVCKALQCSFISASRLDKEANMYVITGGRGVRILFQKLQFYHETFCHLNAADMRRMQQKLNIVVPDGFECYVCAKSKIKRLPFKSSSIKKTKPLQLIHMDLSGHIRVPNRDRYQKSKLSKINL